MPDRRFESEYAKLCAEYVAGDSRLGEVASMLVLARTGVHIEDSSIDDAGDRLACLAERLGLSPEDMQHALQVNEPILAQEWH